MVSPIAPRVPQLPNAPGSGRASPSLPETLSKADIRALEGAEGKKNPDQQGGKPSTTGKHSSNPQARLTTKRSGSVGKSGSKKSLPRNNLLEYGSLQRGGKADSTITKSPIEFSVQPAMTGKSDVLVSADGKKLHNVQGPVAKAIYNDLKSNTPAERPTVWLGEKYAHIPVSALQAHLDTISPTFDQEKMIAVDRDGMIHILNADEDIDTQSYAYIVKQSSQNGNLVAKNDETWQEEFSASGT